MKNSLQNSFNKRIGLWLLVIVSILMIVILIVQVNNYSEKIDILEKQITEYQNSETEIKSMNLTLEQSLNKANILNKVLENQIKQDKTNAVIPEHYYGDYQGNDDFSDIINDNPIDKDYNIDYYEYQESDMIVTTLMWGALEARYTEIWQNEINTALG